MSTSVLSRDLVPDTSMWTLALRLSDTAVDIAVFTDMEDNSLLYRHIALDSGAPSTLKAIEDALYEHPLIFSTFRRTYIDIHPRASMLFPRQLPDPTEVFERTLPGDSREWCVDTRLGGNMALGYALPAGCTAFINRTFSPDAILRPSLGYLASYFTSRPQRGRHRRILANLSSGSVDIIAADGAEITSAVSFVCREPIDAAYYIMACRDMLKHESDDSEIILAGNPDWRRDVMPVLRRFTPNVVPVIFPPRMFRLGREATEMPFDLTVAPLCE